MPEREIIDEAKPWMVIPYFTGDKGRKGIERDPLPPTAVWWLCPSVRVEGGPLRVYTPGEPLDIDVDVRNYGGGAAEALAMVTVWWSDPTSGFGSAKWFGAASAAVTSKGGSATVTITGVIPQGAPAHVCLLVSVEAAFNDNLPAVIAPGSDRHWAQLNIDKVQSADGAFEHQFLAGNPQDVGARLQLHARLVTGERLTLAAHAMGRRPFQPDHADLRVVGDAGELEPGRHEEGAVGIDLESGGSMPLVLRGTIEPAPPAGAAAIVEIVEYAARYPDAPTGGLAIVITTD